MSLAGLRAILSLSGGWCCSVLIYNILTAWFNSQKAVPAPCAFQVLEKTSPQPLGSGSNLHLDDNPCPVCSTGLLRESDGIPAGKASWDG